MTATKDHQSNSVRLAQGQSPIVDATPIVEAILATHRLCPSQRICVDDRGLPGCPWRPGPAELLSAAHRQHRAALIIAAINH